MDLREHDSVPPSSPLFHRKIKLRKLRKSVNAVRVVRLLKSMRRLCLDPAAVQVQGGPVEISTIPRKAQEKLNPCDDQYGHSPHLELKFSNNIGGPIYTGLPVGDQEGSILNLHLIDSRTQNIIKSGPEASAKVEIVVLEKDFTGGNCGGDKSLIRGDPHVSLKDGSVSVSHISFKHTRIPMRKRELRLGARVIYPYNIGARIMRAVTEPFIVKDRRCMGKSLKPLTLNDEVWKLQTIGKDGAFHKRLMKENIRTVKDFLTWYCLNREKLLDILGRRMHVKKLDAAVNKAKSKLELKRYLYPSVNFGVVFTDVGELIGVIYQEGQFLSVEHLNRTQKTSAMELVKTAFQDGHENFKILDDDSFKMLCSSSTSPNSVYPLEAASFDFSNGLPFETHSHCPTDTQQHPVPTAPANSYDSITDALVPDCLDSGDNNCTYRSIWDYWY